MTRPMPVVFFGHGNPMNAISRNTYSEGWASIGKRLPRPDAILAVSAHWYVSSTAVTAMPFPRTIHDFGGFPPELYHVEYPVPGDPVLANRVRSLLAPVAVGLDGGWGLDHGTWSVLRHLFPEADVPVVQLSIDGSRPPSFHYEIGKRLAPLRDEGLLIIGSGNIVHNLRAYSWEDTAKAPFDWGLRFEKRMRELLLTGQDDQIVDYRAMGRDAALSVPTPDHYLPLLYVIALRGPGDTVTFPVEGFDGGSMSMLTVLIG
jgi:4,5-DOPA dioxygenase extradiol